ncbi:MAG: NapC/NirT family cytochrome c [bacterium]
MLNRTSLVGLAIGLSGLVSALFLLAYDYIGGGENPYLGIMTFMVAPAVALTGLLTTTVGAILMRRRLHARGVIEEPFPVIDLNNRHHFRTLVFSIGGGLMLMVVSAVGTYRAYHFTESVSFCGTTCHTVMEPERTAFLSSPHANVQCTTCHIGPGAGWFVKSKVNGLKQVWNTTLDLFPRPIETPIHNLRPAKETCYMCHWPEKFFGSVLMTRTYYRAAEEGNNPWTISMLVNVGGGDSRHGRGQGIHWHMAVDNRIEYVATDKKRADIPWVRQTGKDGKVTVYRTTDKKFTTDVERLSKPEELAKAEVRTMDCIDCHNRPSHQYHSPERSMNESMRAGLIDASLPSIKSLGVTLLDGKYETQTQAVATIEASLRKEFPDADPRVDKAITQIQRIYSENFFPEMKVNWRQYPDHIGHMISPGCFRCHDGQHVSEDGKVIRKDCNICHTIIAQGKGTKIDTVSTGGVEFEHPEDVGEEWKDERCNECHDGMPIL